MDVKYTKNFLSKLEDVFAESDYILRYEKGNFKSGYCILKDTRVVIVNKYYSMEGKVNSLIEILRSIPLDNSRFTDKSKNLYNQILQSEPKP
jgi:hypothetical protein